MSRTAHLKVKIKSLAAEARIIRHEERKYRGLERRALQDHRRGVVRYEARHSQLAYAFIRGRPYSAVEAKCHEAPDWDKVRSIVTRFSDGDKAGVRFDNEWKAWAGEE